MADFPIIPFLVKEGQDIKDIIESIEVAFKMQGRELKEGLKKKAMAIILQGAL